MEGLKAEWLQMILDFHEFAENNSDQLTHKEAKRLMDFCDVKYYACSATRSLWLRMHRTIAALDYALTDKQ